jgi:phosphatidylglycerol lysyltransferase
MISGHCATPVPLRRLPRRCWLPFCGYALGNFIGFGALSGGAVRYRIYSAVGVSPPKIARITIYIATAFGIGAAATIGLGLAFRAHEIAQLYAIPYESLRLIAVLILAATAAVLIGCAFGRQSFRLGPLTIELPSSGLVLVQIAVTMVDIVVAAGTLWVLLPASGVDFLAFVVIFTAALSLGVLSHAPGGIGVFDAAVLYAVGTQVSPSAVAAALVTYRAIYFLLPFAIAAVLLAASELRRWLQRR